MWRWHFYAGIVVAPFAIFLAVTGAILLLKPQNEACGYQDLRAVPVGAAPGWSPPLKAGLARVVDRLASTPPADDHGGHPSGAAAVVDGPYPEAMALDRVLAIAAVHNIPRPFSIGRPVGPTGVSSVISDRNQSFRRTHLHLDQYSGAVLAEIRFKDLGYLAQLLSWGSIAHEGRLFGVPDQIVGTLMFAIVLPLLADSLVVVFAFDWFVGRRWADRERAAAT